MRAPAVGNLGPSQLPWAFWAFPQLDRSWTGSSRRQAACCSARTLRAGGGSPPPDQLAVAKGRKRGSRESVLSRLWAAERAALLEGGAEELDLEARRPGYEARVSRYAYAYAGVRATRRQSRQTQATGTDRRAVAATAMMGINNIYESDDHLRLPTHAHAHMHVRPSVSSQRASKASGACLGRARVSTTRRRRLDSMSP